MVLMASNYVFNLLLLGTLALCTSITVLLITQAPKFSMVFCRCSQSYSRNLKLRKTRWAAWYTFATIAMFTSTSIYWAFILRDTFTIAGITISAVNNLDPAINSLEGCLSVYGGTRCSGFLFESSPNDVAVNLAISRLTTHDIVLEYCVGTAALTTNVRSSVPTLS